MRNDDITEIINYYGQLFLLVWATCCLALGLIGLLMVAIFLWYILPVLGIWQAIDFIALWIKQGYKKWYMWYILYICIVLLSLFFASFTKNDNVVSIIIFIILVCYSITISWKYLLDWRKN